MCKFSCPIKINVVVSDCRVHVDVTAAYSLGFDFSWTNSGFLDCVNLLQTL